MFFDEGGLIEDSIISGNVSGINGGIAYGYSSVLDPGSLGTVNNSTLWNNGSQATLWAETGNQTINPASVTNAAAGANIEAYSYADAETRTTGYFNDLNGNTVKRVYPSRVVETRSFDAMNRLLTLKTETIGRDWFGIEYDYDAVGSARRMEHTRSGSLAGKAPAAVYTWGYDDRYRRPAKVSPSPEERTMPTRGIVPTTAGPKRNLRTACRRPTSPTPTTPSTRSPAGMIPWRARMWLTSTTGSFYVKNHNVQVIRR